MLLLLLGTKGAFVGDLGAYGIGVFVIGSSIVENANAEACTWGWRVFLYWSL